MKIDFHTHGKLAKKLPFSVEYTDWLLKEAKVAGLDAICLTEHFNTLGFAEVYQYMEAHYEVDGDTFLYDGLRIFPGMETDIAEGGHVLCVGTMDVILELNQKLEGHKTKETFLPLKDMLHLFSEYPVIVGAAHAYREGGHIPEQPEEVLKGFDFFDVNGKDYALRGEIARQEIQALGDRMHRPCVAGSDTHQAFQYGCIWNEVKEECNTIEQLKHVMDKGHYEIKISDEISFRVKTAGTLKKALKAIHQLGGDYVSILTEQA